jgi:hypothetical protein
MKPISVLRLHGFIVNNHEVLAWCGHRWNCYGLLVGDMLRFAHCMACSDDGVAHLVILSGRLNGRPAADLRRRWLTVPNGRPLACARHCLGSRLPEHNCSVLDAWRQRQEAAVNKYLDAVAANGTIIGSDRRAWCGGAA